MLVRLRTRVVPGRELDHHVGPDHLHGAARLLPLAHAEADAEDEADGDHARLRLGRRVVAGRRRRRGEGGAAGGRGLPQGPGPLQGARRERPEGHHAPRPARHRQDAAGQGRREGVRREVLRAVGLLVRGDVRRPRRGAHPAPVPDRPRQPPGDHLHRRDRRRRRRARLGQQLRARADAQPAAGRDGRLPLLRRPRRDRRLQPARQARPGAAAPRPLRPPDLRLPARRGRPRGDHARAHRRASRWPTTSTSS